MTELGGRGLGARPWMLALALAGCLASPPDASARQEDDEGLLIGFTAFPYDFTEEAVQRVHDIILPNSNLYAIHL
ncbi:MAG: hypothetical protein ACRD21_26480, partial [Vicinamibacteria bacterium]